MDTELGSGEYIYIIVTDMEGIMRIYRPKGVVRTRGNDITRTGGERNICFTVGTLTQGQSVYPEKKLSRNSEGHMESVQPIKCMLFILICYNYIIVTSMEGNIRIYRLPKGRSTEQWKLYCSSQRRGKYQFHGPYQEPRAVCLS